MLPIEHWWASNDRSCYTRCMTCPECKIKTRADQSEPCRTCAQQAFIDRLSRLLGDQVQICVPDGSDIDRTRRTISNIVVKVGTTQVDAHVLDDQQLMRLIEQAVATGSDLNRLIGNRRINGAPPNIRISPTR